MNSSSPYGPDHSLPIAAAILIGGGLLSGAVIYLLSTTAGTLTDWHRARLAEAQAQQREQARAPGQRPVRQPDPSPRPKRTPNRPRRSSAFPSHGPSWHKSDRGGTPPHSPTWGTYDLHPDMSLANLGAPSENPNSKTTSDNAPPIEPGGFTGEGSSGGDPPLTADLGTKPSGVDGTWRSEASKLARTARSLSGELAHLDRANGPSTKTGRSRRNPASGRASTASTGQGPHIPGDAPDTPTDPPQVPVDGGVGWLAAAGAAYAANRLRKQEETDKPDEED